MSYWSIAGGVVGGIVGGVAAVYSCGATSALVPACISGGMAIGGAVGGAVDSDNAADESEAKQKLASEKQSKINEDQVRAAKRKAYEEAQKTNSSSDELFKVAALRRGAEDQYAATQDYGKPFTPAEEKRLQRTPVAPQVNTNRETEVS